MESITIEEQIDSKYLIEGKIGTGFTANAFLVKEKNSGLKYVAKVFKEKKKYLFENEVKILNILKQFNNPYIVNIIDSGEGDIIRNNRETVKSKYYILEYATHGNLFDYIYCKQGGLGELYSKVIFSKIIKGILICHTNDICHRDIKLDNILLNDDFSPKICDFGFACINNPNLEDDLGTEGYKSPEIGRKKYDGKKVDIFALGVSLMILVTGKPGFLIANKDDEYFDKIRKQFFETYWKMFEKQIPGIILTPEFKDLYIKLVSYSPNKRLNAEDILNHPWFKELDEIKKNDEQKEKIDDEIKQVFLKLENDVKIYSKKEIEAKNKKSEEAFKTRSGHNENEYFDSHIKPKFDNTYNNMNYCIKIKGTLNPNKFMNSLVNLLLKKYCDTCLIETDDNKLKFIAIFEEETKDKITKEFIEEIKKLGINVEDEKEDNNELKIKIKLYQISEGYSLRFIHQFGDRKNFLEKYDDISKLIENLIN